MKYTLMGLGALMLAGCAGGISLPVLPEAPTADQVTEAQVEAGAEVEKVCENLNLNEKNLKGWLDLATVLGGAFDIDVGKWVEIPADLVDAKEAVCE